MRQCYGSKPAITDVPPEGENTLRIHSPRSFQQLLRWFFHMGFRKKEKKQTKTKRFFGDRWANGWCFGTGRTVRSSGPDPYVDPVDPWCSPLKGTKTRSSRPSHLRKSVGQQPGVHSSCWENSHAKRPSRPERPRTATKSAYASGDGDGRRSGGV